MTPIPDLGRPGSEGGGAGYGAVTAPSRPALNTGSGSYTKNCEHFRNAVVEKLRGKTPTCSSFGVAKAPQFRSTVTLFRAYSLQKRSVFSISLTILQKIECLRLSVGLPERLILLPDSWQGRDATLTLTSGTEGDGERIPLV